MSFCITIFTIHNDYLWVELKNSVTILYLPILDDRQINFDFCFIGKAGKGKKNYKGNNEIKKWKTAKKIKKFQNEKL